jgi:uncharacterized membrane protein YkoI
MFKVVSIACSLALGWLAATGAMSMTSMHAPTTTIGTSAQTVSTCAGVSLDQAVAMVTAKYRARVNRATTVQQGGRIVHEIRLVTADGSRVWTVRVDAETGQEL